MLAKGQVLSTVLVQPTAVIASNISIADLMGLIDEGDDTMRSSDQNNEVIIAVPPHQGKDDPAARDGNAMSVADLHLSHVPLKCSYRLREMLSNYVKMWDGSLGEITTTEHHIDLIAEARPVAFPPY